MTQKMERTTAGLRSVILDELETLRSGETNESRAHAVARLANAAIATVRLEIDAREMLMDCAEKTRPALKSISLVA